MAIAEIIHGQLVVMPEALKDAIYGLEDAARREQLKGKHASMASPEITGARNALIREIASFAAGYASFLPDALDRTAGDLRQAQALLAEAAGLIEKAEASAQRAQGGQRGMPLHV